MGFLCTCDFWLGFKGSPVGARIISGAACDDLEMHLSGWWSGHSRMRRDLGTVAEASIATFQWRAEGMELGKQEEVVSLSCVIKELP